MRYKEITNDHIDPEYYEKLAMVESSGNPRAKAKTSSAAGLYQFTKGTWEDMVKNLGLDFSLEDRFDPKKSRRVVEALTKSNYNYLKRNLGREVTQSELYMAHFIGMGGSRNFLRAYEENPNTKVNEVLSRNQIVANRNVFLNKDGTPKSVKDIYKWANKKFGVEESYDFNKDPDNLFTPENTIENRRSQEYAPQQREEVMQYAGLLNNFQPTTVPQQETEDTRLAKQSIDNTKNKMNILQELIQASQVQYIEQEENKI